MATPKRGRDEEQAELRRRGRERKKGRCLVGARVCGKPSIPMLGSKRGRTRSGLKEKGTYGETERTGKSARRIGRHAGTREGPRILSRPGA